MIQAIKYYFKYLNRLFSLGFINFFFNRNKFRIFTKSVIDFQTYYDINAESKILKGIELTDILKTNGSPDKIIIEDYIYRQGNVSLYELYCISSIAKHFAPGLIFEIGTFDGRSTLHLALNTPGSTRICTLDLPEDNKNIMLAVDSGDIQLIDKKGFRTGEKFIGREESKRITQYFDDSAKFDYSDFNDKVDLFFIDGAHSFDYVKSDTENAFKCLKDGGIIIWHDYGNIIDVIRYLNSLGSEKPVYRIYQTTLAVYSKSFNL